MPSQLFASGFEGGSYVADGWDGTTVSGPNQTISVTAAAARSGANGSRSVMNQTATDQPFEAKVTKTVQETPNLHLYAQTWVRMSNVLSVGYSAIGSKSVLTLRAADGQPLAWFSIRTGGLRMSYMQRNGIAATINSFIPLPAGQWRGLRLLLNREGFAPVVEGWITSDGSTWTPVGSQVATLEGASGVAKRPATVDVGIAHITNFETGQYIVDHDDVELRHSLSVGTEWSSLFTVPIPVYPAFLGRINQDGIGQGWIRTAAMTQAARSSTGRVAYLESLAGYLTGRREVAGLSEWLLDASGATQALITRFGTSEGFARLSGASAAVTAALGIGKLDYFLLTKVLTEAGVPTVAISTVASDQVWGMTLITDEAVGEIEAMDTRQGVLATSDEKG